MMQYSHPKWSCQYVNHARPQRGRTHRQTRLISVSSHRSVLRLPFRIAEFARHIRRRVGLLISSEINHPLRWRHPPPPSLRRTCRGTENTRAHECRQTAPRSAAIRSPVAGGGRGVAMDSPPWLGVAGQRSRPPPWQHERTLDWPRVCGDRPTLSSLRALSSLARRSARAKAAPCLCASVVQFLFSSFAEPTAVL